MSSVFVHLEEEDDFEVYKQCRLCVVDFYANWCGPCKVLSTNLEQLISKDNELSEKLLKDVETENLSNKVVFLKINVDEFGDLASVYKCRSIPYILFFKTKLKA